MSAVHEGYSNTVQYRSSLIKFGLPYVAVTAVGFSASLIGADEIHWLHYILGWLVAVTLLVVAYIRPDLWLLAPFGALAGALLVRSATDGLDAGLGPLLMIPAIAVAVYGSRRALVSMLLMIAGTVMVIAIVATEDPTFSPAWRQDAILVVLAIVLAVAIQDLVTRMRSDRALADERGRQIELLNEITRAIATSPNGARTLCATAVETTPAAGVALFHTTDDEGLRLLAWSEGNREALARMASDPGLSPNRVLDTGRREVATIDAAEDPREPAAWDTDLISTVVWEPIRFNERTIGVLALAFEGEWDPEDQGPIPVELLAAEGTVAIQQWQFTDQLDHLATTDPLTDIDNRRGWQRMITRATTRAQRLDYPLCLALLDLDHFKQFNDTHGHQAGDDFLKRCALAWQGLMRGDDHIARYGGEEFVVTLPNTTVAQATEIVERLRAAVPDGETCSGGIALWDVGEPVEDLVKRADDALYRAKESGRDTTVAADRRQPSE